MDRSEVTCQNNKSLSKRLYLEVHLYHFSIPRVLIINNGHQFSGAKLAKFCKDLGISHYFTSIGHPQANRKVEVANVILFQGLKTRLD